MKLYIVKEQAISNNIVWAEYLHGVNGLKSISYETNDWTEVVESSTFSEYGWAVYGWSDRKIAVRKCQELRKRYEEEGGKDSNGRCDMKTHRFLIVCHHMSWYDYLAWRGTR